MRDHDKLVKKRGNGEARTALFGNAAFLSAHVYRQRLTEDEEGLEFADEAAAREAAVAGLRDVTAGDLARGELNMGSFIEIENERHELVATISFEDAVQVREESAPASSSRRWPSLH